MMRSLPSAKIQIIGRYVPAENRSGPFTYLLDFMRYLHYTGCVLELVVLDQWFQECNIPQAVQDIAHVVIMPPPSKPDEGIYKRVFIRSLLRSFYSHLPHRVLHPLRKAVYRLRKQQLPGVHAHDAFATEEEIVFTGRRAIEFQPDVMIANHTYLGKIFTGLVETQRVLKVILTHHIEYQRTKDFDNAGLQSHDSVWERENEVNQLKYADVLLAIQRDDANVLKKMVPQCEVFCTPMSAKYDAHHAEEQVPGRCLFIASAIEHNVYGLHWFLGQVWPIVLRTVPQSSLHVCGSVCSKIQGTYSNVRLLGRMDNLEHEYAAAEVCLIPLVVGSGLKIKLVEALSHGRACVSTSVGIQGIQEITNKAALVANTPEEFAKAVITILSNPEKRKAMEELAEKYVTEHLSPEKVYQPFVNRIYQHVREQKGR